ncbi:hypothetical protein [Alicyclobacillus sp. SO9]|uniref:hypothetical protein n=1 Tax=Alicyclobacillus sp. SO9 TaxID=2665646 RepID=UPI0018E8156C|nr:hypothetical protein [Alicyclobacillus sp. SO9]QQE79618.1 hypothetical protein GI364_03755 [Alicyclobacillus sp. SO9]
MCKEIVQTKTGKVFLEDTMEDAMEETMEGCGEGRGNMSEGTQTAQRESAVGTAYRKLAELLLKDFNTNRQEADD